MQTGTMKPTIIVWHTAYNQMSRRSNLKYTNYLIQNFAHRQTPIDDKKNIITFNSHCYRNPKTSIVAALSANPCHWLNLSIVL